MSSKSDSDTGGETPRCHDAVVVVPGIMGSELVSRDTGETLWGMRDLRWYVRAWTRKSSLRALQLTDAELSGRYGRVQATGLLRFPAFAPVLQGFEPYSRLLHEIKSVVIHPEAVVEFPYDWRLPVTHNARLLADTVHRLHTAWAARTTRLDEPNVVIVAHSMGGLLTRHLGNIPGALDPVRRIVTLGTPYYGSVKAAVAMNSGRGQPVPLPRKRFRDLAVGLPGLYDLLPRYRCVDSGSTAERLHPTDVALLGGDVELARQAEQRHADVASTALDDLIQVVGAHQPTAQSITIRDGVALPHNYTCRPVTGERTPAVDRVDLGGDGTVSRESAQLHSISVTPLAQTHGAVATSLETCLLVQDALTRRDTGPWQGAGTVGIDVPDLVLPETPFVVRLDGVDHPRDVACRIEDASTGRTVAVPRVVSTDSHVSVSVGLNLPGMYRILVTGGGASSTSQIFVVSEQ
ncbi:hypothetical protein OG604_34030 [Streptomyces sp. NBC_01231]|nr:hypothetical protein OG604_34030 [Streptomyces sp. NBC_01231]